MNQGRAGGNRHVSEGYIVAWKATLPQWFHTAVAEAGASTVAFPHTTSEFNNLSILASGCMVLSGNVGDLVVDCFFPMQLQTFAVSRLLLLPLYGFLVLFSGSGSAMEVALRHHNTCSSFKLDPVQVVGLKLT